MSAVAELTWTAEESKPELVSLFGNAPLGLAHCHRTGIITAVNPTLEELTGVRFRTSGSLELPVFRVRC